MQIHHLKGHIQDTYMAVYPDKILLLDGACRCDIPLITDFITKELKRDLSQLKLVLVTHMHPDHAGAAQGLRKIAGCKIAAPNKDKHWYGGISGGLMYFVDQFLANWLTRKLKRKSKNLFFNPYLKPDYKLNDGDTLPGFDDWQVLETPGHTDRDLSAYHSQSKSVYIADLMIRSRYGYIAPFPIYLPEKYRSSLHKIKALNLQTHYLAHGGKVRVSDEEFNSFISNKIPARPSTIKHSLKNKIKNYIKMF